MKMRKEFSQKVKANAALRANGHCEICTAKLFTGKIEYDHVVPDALGGENTLENCQCVCSTCHKNKSSKEDIPRIAKANRNYRKSQGIKKQSRFACARNSKWKKKINGEVIER